MTSNLSAAVVRVLPVSIPGSFKIERTDRLLLVEDPDLGTVPVRWRLSPSTQIWRCSACGPQSEAGCRHAFSAALHLAQSLLGLTPNPDAVAPATHTPQETR